MQTPAYNNVEKALYKWFVTIHASNIPISGPMLPTESAGFARIFGQDDFSARSGWLQRFKDDYDIVGKVVTSESCMADVDNIKNWPRITSNGHPHDILNGDESGLLWSLHSESCHGVQILKL